MSEISRSGSANISGRAADQTNQTEDVSPLESSKDKNSALPSEDVADRLSTFTKNEFQEVVEQATNGSVAMEGSGPTIKEALQFTAGTELIPFEDVGGGTGIQGKGQVGGSIEGNYRNDWRTDTTDIGGHDVGGGAGLDIDFHGGGQAEGSYGIDGDFSDGTGGVDLHGEAFIGGKASVEAGVSLNIDGKDLAGINIGGSVSGGAGVEGGFHIGIEDGVFHIGVNFGGSAGAGGSVGIGVFVDIGSIFGFGPSLDEQWADMEKNLYDAWVSVTGTMMDADLATAQRNIESAMKTIDEIEKQGQGPGEDIYEEPSQPSGSSSPSGPSGPSEPAGTGEDIYWDIDHPSGDTGKTDGSTAPDDPQNKEEDTDQEEDIYWDIDHPEGDTGYASDFQDDGFAAWMSNPLFMRHVRIPGGVGGGDSMSGGGGDPTPDGETGGSPSLPGRTGSTGGTDDDDKTTQAPDFGPYLGDYDTIIHPKANPALFSIAGTVFGQLDLSESVADELQKGLTGE